MSKYTLIGIFDSLLCTCNLLRVWHIIGAIRTGFIGKTSGIFISHVLTKIQQANVFFTSKLYNKESVIC